jgi:hypothetical protein
MISSQTLLVAQTDTAKVKLEGKIDTINTLSKRFIPERAALYAFVLPGLGQAYNKKYWKIPILYGGAGALGYAVYWNNNRFLRFKDSFNAKQNQNTAQDPYPQLSLESVKLNRDYSRRNRDFSIILCIALHALNVLDATVDAHLKTFDIDDNIRTSIEPSFDTFGSNPVYGMSFKVNFWAGK